MKHCFNQTTRILLVAPIRMLLLIAIAALLASGCTGVRVIRQPIHVDSDAFNHDIHEIYVTPVIDARIDKAAVFDDSDTDNLRKLVKEDLNGRGYQVNLLDSWKSDEQLSDIVLSDMNAEELSTITPVEAKVFFVITINDVHDTYKVMSSNYSINGIMMAIDRQQRKEIWKDAATGTHGGGGIIGAALDAIINKSSAQSFLIKEVMSSFPERD